jgi:DNA-binding HxlR family transcriptional regulator
LGFIGAGLFMYTDYIGKKMEGVSPRTKLFLLLWLRFFQETEVVLSHTELSSRFSMSLKLIAKALKELQATGVIQREINAKRKGQPTYRYRANASTAMSKVKKRFSRFQQGLSPNKVDRKKQIIDDIIESSNDGLDTSRRLLLLTLWHQANDVGVIHGVGVGHLAKLVGCSKDSIRRYLKDLMGNDYLAKVCTGFTAEAFFGVRDSVYVLNPPLAASYYISETTYNNERNTSILTSMSNALVSLREEEGFNDGFLDRLVTDFSLGAVQGYFLYWFWQYAYSTVYESLGEEILSITEYRLKTLEQRSKSDINRLAELLFSSRALKAQGELSAKQFAVIEFIHKLAVTTVLSTSSQDFNDTQGKYPTEKLIYLLPKGGIYQKK